jgi:septum formation protein
MQIILASKSKDRKKILKNLGIPFKVKVSDIDESHHKESIKDPILLVQKLAELKARNVKEKIGKKDILGIIIAADTVVEYKGEIVGKAKTEQEAFKILKSLSGKKHNLITGYALVDLSKEKSYINYDLTQVKFLKLSKKDIWNYIKTEEWKGRAGAYSLRERASLFVEWINGSFSNVLGLPIDKIFPILKDEFGIDFLSI